MAKQRDMRGWIALCLLLVGWLGWTQVAVAKDKLTTNDILTLLQMGYTEAQIIKQIDASKMRGKFQLTPLQALKLRKAGGTIRLIRVMRLGTKAKAKPRIAPRPRPVPRNTSPPISFHELKGWLDTQKPTAWIKKQLKQRGIVKAEFGAFALLQLNQAGMPLSLLQYIETLKKRPNTPAPRPAAKAPKRPAPVAQRPRPRRTAPPIVRRVVPLVPPVRRPTRRVPPRPLPRVTISTNVQQALQARLKRIKSRAAKRITLPQNRRYQHIGRLYQVTLPKGWAVIEDLHPDHGGLFVHLTPQPTKRMDQLQKGIWFQVGWQTANQRRRNKANDQHDIQRWLRTMQVSEPTLKVKQGISKHTFQQRNAWTFAMEGRPSTSQHTLHTKVIVVRHRRALIRIGIYAPPKEFAAFDKQAQAVLSTCQLLTHAQLGRGKRLTKEHSVQTVIRNNTKGVVSISLGIRKRGKLTFRAAGTGFVVTSNGYVLTNWHVAVNMRTNKPYEKYVLNWDQTTGRKSVHATYVGAHFQWPSWKKIRLVDPKTGRISVRFQRQHVDIALLKIIPKGTYPTVALSSVRNAMLGDTVVAMGFPLEGRGISDIGNETITATTGRISRMVRMANKRVNEIQHTAKVAGGNSGGPLFDTATGRVIGINTWVGTFDKKQARPGMGLGYYYALPIDLAWRYFPDYLEYDPTLTARQWYALGVKWMANQQFAPAQRALQLALKRDPNCMPAYVMLAKLFQARSEQYKDDTSAKWLAKARRWADKGLKKDPYHLGLMKEMARISLYQGQWQTASVLVKQALAATPNDWTLYAVRSLLHSFRGNHTAALRDAGKVIQLNAQKLADGQILRGFVLYRAKRFFEGQRAYRQALTIDKHNLQALLGEAEGYKHLKQEADALRHYQAITKQFPYEPEVYRAELKMLYLASLPNAKRQAWDAFQMLSRCSRLRGTQIHADALFLGGILAETVLNKALQQRVLWGLWGRLFDKHTKKTFTARAALALATVASKKGQRGLAYALLNILPQNKYVANKALRKLYTRLRGQTAKTGLSDQELRFLVLQTYPRWSPRLLWRIFRMTPTLISKTTAQVMLKKGVPSQLVLMMWRLSKKRRKAGIRPPQAGQGGQLTARQRRLQQANRRPIHQVATLANRSLIRGDMDTWMAIHAPVPGGTNYKAKRIFGIFRKGLRTRKIIIYNVNKITIRFARHPRYGTIARWYFPMKIGAQPTKLYYWNLRIYGNRWVLFQ